MTSTHTCNTAEPEAVDLFVALRARQTDFTESRHPVTARYEMCGYRAGVQTALFLCREALHSGAGTDISNVPSAMQEHPLVGVSRRARRAYTTGFAAARADTAESIESWLQRAVPD